MRLPHLKLITIKGLGLIGFQTAHLLIWKLRIALYCLSGLGVRAWVGSLIRRLREKTFFHN